MQADCWLLISCMSWCGVHYVYQSVQTICYSKNQDVGGNTFGIDLVVLRPNMTEHIVVLLVIDCAHL